MGAQESVLRQNDLYPVTEAQFTINGKPYRANADGKYITATTTLNSYIRYVAELKGTKAMCLEGGCGSCVVTAEIINPITRRKCLLAVNSCLVTILSCDGWNITTIEGIGNKKEGYHVIQKTLAEYNGTQCGFCSPGFVMSMYALYETNENLTKSEIETSFGGNICRCTGYRPICDAFRSLTEGGDCKSKCENIENITKCFENRLKITEINDQTFDVIEVPKQQPDMKKFLDSETQKWFRVPNLEELCQLLVKIGDVKYMLVAGNTAYGVIRRDPDIEVFIDITAVPELHEIEMSDSVSIGGSVTLTDTITVLKKIAKDRPGFAYLNDIAEHYELVANVPVRNIGTLAGNLMIKYITRRFQSDVFLTLETFGAKLRIVDKYQDEPKLVLPSEFLELNMNGRIIQSIILQPLVGNHMYKTYKIMPRAQNAAAIVNAGFLFEMGGDLNTIMNATIVYGNINSQFTHAFVTEKLLDGKNLFDDGTLQLAFRSLETELRTDVDPPEAAPENRRQLAIALFYKFVLASAPSNMINTWYQSGGTMLDRPLSQSKQDYQTHCDEYPLTKPIPKLEALAQTSGEAKFVVDTDVSRNDFTFGAFILAKAEPGSTIKSLNSQKALDYPGVIAVFTANDIIKENNFIPKRNVLTTDVPEEVFCSGTVKYNGQSLGLVVAKTDQIANDAVKLVEVLYDPPKPDSQPRVYETRDGINIPNNPRIKQIRSMERKKRGNGVKRIIRGQFDVGPQYHFSMESQACVVIPIEDGLDVYPSTQWMDNIQKAICACTGLTEKEVNVQVRRLGSAYGGKISRANLTACAAATAAVKLQQPCYIRMTIEDNIECIGKRFPCSMNYEAGVNASGKIQYCNLSYYSNYGYMTNEAIDEFLFPPLTNVYDVSTWQIEGYSVETDAAANAYMRGPGATEAFAMAESLMDHIATDLNLSGSNVRIQNLKTDDDTLEKMIKAYRDDAEIAERMVSIENFNERNRWRKRGISMAIMSFPIEFLYPFTSFVSIYYEDGSVVITHGGIEMGQGINTKAAQVAAYILGCDLSFVQVKPSNVLTSPNNMTTGGSIGSDSVCYGVMKACQELSSKMQPIKSKMKDVTWVDVTRECQTALVDLVAHYTFTDRDKEIEPYNVYGLSFADVEIDLLTGQHQIRRVDLLVDAGESLSPEVDVGQIEGAYVTGLGYWLTENIIFSDDDGAILTNRTWNYHPPTWMDIPIDWRTEFRKNSSNPKGVLRSKATGEPALCVAVAVPLAIRQALVSARKDSDSKADSWVAFQGPTTVDATLQYSIPNYSQYKLK